MNPNIPPCMMFPGDPRYHHPMPGIPPPFMPVAPSSSYMQQQQQPQQHPQSSKLRPPANQGKSRSAFDFSLDEDISLDRDLIPGSSQPYSSLNADKMEGNDSENEFSGEEQEMFRPLQKKEAMKELLDKMNEEQLKRYELFRRAHLPKASMKKLLQTELSQPVTSSTTIVFSGCGKMFIGEIVELAKSIMEEKGEEGAIKPDHLREAYYRYRKLHPKRSSNLHKKRLFH